MRGADGFDGDVGMRGSVAGDRVWIRGRFEVFEVRVLAC